MNEDVPEVEVFDLPHPYDLAQSELILPGKWDEEFWKPTAEDYRQLEQYYDHDDDSVVIMEYSLAGVSGNKVLISVKTEGESCSDEEFLVLFQIRGNRMYPVRDIDPMRIAFKQAYSPSLAAQRNHNEDGYDYWKSQPTYDVSKHFMLHGTCLLSEGQNSEEERAIVITDVETGRLSWFRPEVPESELDPATVALLRCRLNPP